MLLISITALAGINYFLTKKLSSKYAVLGIFFCSNIVYFYLHSISKSIFISTILLVCSSLSFLIANNNLKIEFTKKSLGLYLIANFIILSLAYSFSNSDSEINYKFFFPEYDNFSDSVKLVVAFEFFFDEDDLNNIKHLNENFLKEAGDGKTKVRYNEYFLEYEDEVIESGYCSVTKELEDRCIEIFSDGILNYFNLPPLHLLIKSFFAFLLSLLNNMYSFIIFISFLLSFSIYSFTKKYFPEERKMLFIFQLTSYPFVFAILRGNLTSILTYLLAAILLIRYYKNSENSFLDLILLAAIVNIRPMFIFFVILFIDIKKPKETIKNMLLLAISAISIFFVTLNIAGVIHPNYDLGNFLKMLFFHGDFNVYEQFATYESTKLKTNAFNFGLYSFLLNLKEVFIILLERAGFISVLEKITAPNLYLLANLFVVIYFLRVLILKLLNKLDKDELIIKTSCLILLIGPANGDYHLMLLLILFMILYNGSPTEVKNSHRLIPIILLIFLIKPHSTVVPLYGIGISTLLNTLLILFLLITNIRNKKVN